MTQSNRSSQSINRREFLRLSSLAAGAAVISACAPQATPAPAAEAPQATAVPPTEAPKATEAPAAEATAVPTTAPVANKATKVTLMSWGGAERFTKWIDTYKGTYPDLSSWLTVEPVSGGGGDSDMFNMFRTAMAAGGEGLPDIFESNATNIPEFATRGLMLEIDDYLKSTGAKLIPAAQAVAGYNGHYYGVPMQVKSKVWWYRKDMFEKAGIKPEDVKTLDDFINAGKALHGAYPDAYMFNLSPKSSGGWLSMLHSAFKDLKFAEDANTWNVTKDQRFADMFDIVKKIYKANIASPVGDWSTDWSPAMTDSKIASVIGPSGASWMAEFLPQFDTKHAGQWGLALWPEFSRYGSESGGSVWALTKFSKAPEAAFKFLSNFFLTPEGAVAMYKVYGFLPMIEGAQDAVKAEAAKKEKPAGMTDDQWKMASVNYFGVEYIDALIKAMDYVVIPPYDMAYNNEMGILGQYCDEYVEDKLSLKDALKTAEDEMKTQIVDPYKLG